ncbi:MAG: co-chaperone GroES [Thermoguttaceae bacterium]|nr:co-chaperone GroES [Thermoguttaceae bacterium]MDW8037037.1 co-chaperone GroES [Thermoguttaceae bacterium]
MKLVPLADKIVVRQLPEEPKTSKRILMPERSPGWIQQGRVLSVGDGWLLPDGSRAKLQINEGDRVLFANLGTEVILNGESLLILSEQEVLAVVEKGSA